MSNNLPEGWKETTLDEIAFINPPENLKNGIKAKKVTMDMLIPFTKIIPTYSIEEYEGGMKFRNGDTLIARITPCLENGKTAYVDILDDGEIGFGSTEFIVLREKEDRSDKHFLYYFSMSPNFRDVAILSMTGSSGRQRVQTEVIRNHLFLLPPLPEQRAIASVLSSLDDKIDLLNRENQTLEKMAEALFRQWFIEEADEKLEEVKLKNLVDFEKGKKPQETFQLQMPGLVPQVLIETFDDGNVMYSKPDGMVIANENDILIVMDGASSGRVEIGFSGIVGSTIGLFQKRSDFPYSLFLYYFLKSKEDYIREHTTGSAIPHADKALILNLDVKFSNIAYVKKFELITKDLFEKLKLNRSQIRTLEKLRDTLLPKLMSGEVRVKL